MSEQPAPEVTQTGELSIYVFSDGHAETEIDFRDEAALSYKDIAKHLYAAARNYERLYRDTRKKKDKGKSK